MRPTNFVTVPGVPKPVVASRMTGYKTAQPVQDLGNVPTGDAVSKVYPWVCSFKQVVSGVSQAEIRLVRPGIGSSAFLNTSDRVINVNELRFFVAVPFKSLGSIYISNRMAVKIHHTDYEIVPEWLPMGMIQTHNQKMIIDGPPDFTMSLPTPYYLQAGHAFRVRVRATCPYDGVNSYSFWMTLFGKDPKNDKPYEICKQVTIPYRAAPVVSDANPMYVDVVFDDNRDYPMRDMLLTHFGAAVIPFVAVAQSAIYQYPLQLDLQFMPPEGPKWMDFVDWAPIGNVVDQCEIGYVGGVHYKPETPIVINPRQGIDIDLKNILAMKYLSGQREVYEVPLWVTLLGTQEQKVQG